MFVVSHGGTANTALAHMVKPVRVLTRKQTHGLCRADTQ